VRPDFGEARLLVDQDLERFSGRTELEEPPRAEGATDRPATPGAKDGGTPDAI
jgi:hypothetical protein